MSHGGGGDARLSRGRVPPLEHPSRAQPVPPASTARAAPGHSSGGGGREGVGSGFPSRTRAGGGSARAGGSGELRTAEPGSRARTGSQEPRSARRTGPSVPEGQGLGLRRWRGLTSHGTGTCSREGWEHGNTPASSSSAVVKRPPFLSPSSACPPPEAAEQGHRRQEARGTSGAAAAAVPFSSRLPVRTPTRI